MFHEPRGFVGNLQSAMKLVRADAFLAARHQMSGLEPSVQLDMTALKDRSYGDGELALARTAAPQPRATALNRRDPVKATATRAIWAIRPQDCL
jgi:hypothetical protein